MPNISDQLRSGFATRCIALSILYSNTVLVLAQVPQFNGNDGSRGDSDPAQRSAQPSQQSAGQITPTEQLQYFINGDALPQRRSMLIAHAVIACTVWAVLVPIGGILLRMNIKSPWIVRLHALLQMVSFFSYVAAVGLGIFLINTLGTFSAQAWKEAHPRLGLAILALAAIQPLLGYIHHKLYKRRVAELRQSGSDEAPRSTTWGHIHLWLGRSLIILGIVNGGLGLKLAQRSPSWLMPPPKPAMVAYAVSASLSVLVYVIVVAVASRKRVAKRRRPMGIDSAEEDPQVKEHHGTHGMNGM